MSAMFFFGAKLAFWCWGLMRWVRFLHFNYCTMHSEKVFIKRCQTSRTWFLLRWYTRNKHLPSALLKNSYITQVGCHFVFQEINKQELEVAHAGDLYDKAHGDSMRAEKALKAPGLDDFGFPPIFGKGVGLPGTTRKSLEEFGFVSFGFVFRHFWGMRWFLGGQLMSVRERITSWPWLLQRNVAMIWSVRLMRWWPRFGLYNVLWGYGDYIEDPW